MGRTQKPARERNGMKASLFFAAVLALGALSLFQGCAVENTGCVGGSCSCDTPACLADSGNVTFEWNFAGSTCVQTPAVNSVNITMTASDGTPQVLPPLAGSNLGPGQYPCVTNGTDGVVLTNFVPDTYSYTINAVDVNGFLLYTGAGTVTVNGPQVVQVSLTAVPTSTLTLNWTFAGQNCAQANVTGVKITLNDQAPIMVPCTSATPGVGDGVALNDLALNTTYQMRLDSIDNVGPTDGLTHFALISSAIVTTTSGQKSTVDLLWAATGLVLSWEFNGSDCVTAGVNSLLLTLQEVANGTFVNLNAEAGACLACSPSSVTFPYLWAGDTLVSGSTGSYFTADYTLNATGYFDAACTAASPFTATNVDISVQANQQPQNSFTADLGQ
jgi:hypothetical protein